MANIRNNQPYSDKIPLTFSRIPNRMFIPAVRVRDIVKARPLTQEEKSNIKRGSPDILIEPLIGESYLLYRNDVVGNFRYTNGSKIKTSGWESTKQYIIYRNDNTNVMVMQVPLNHTVEVNGKVANAKSRSSGEYIVCTLDESGEISRESAKIVTSAVFRKMCYIPRNDVITRHRGSKNKLFNFFDTVRGAFTTVDRSNNFIRPMNRVKLPNSNNTIPKPNLAQVNRVNTIGQIDKSQSKYTIIGQIHDNYGKRVGFVIQSYSGETKDIPKNVAIKLAQSKKLANAELVVNAGVEPYLRGNGIKLDELPIKYR